MAQNTTVVNIDYGLKWCMFAGVHTDKEEPPQVPMFGNQRKHTRTTSITRELTYQTHSQV